MPRMTNKIAATRQSDALHLSQCSEIWPNFYGLPSGVLCGQADGLGRFLVVADLHFEKGSAYAQRGQMLPPFDTLETLTRLEAIVADIAPDTLISLGDGFHDMSAGLRLHEDVASRLSALASRQDTIWVVGNHDPAPPVGVAGRVVDKVMIGDIALQHELPPHWHAGRANARTIIGHYHPIARVATPMGRVRKPCFIADNALMILPAFGAFAGGLNVRSPAIANLFDAPKVWALGQKSLFEIAPGALLD